MKKYYLILSLVLFAMAGCSATPPKTEAINQIIETTTYSYCEPGSKSCPKSDFNYLAQYNAAESDTEKQKNIRNKIISEQMRLIDEEFRIYEKNLGTDVDYKNFAVHVASIGLSAAATVVGGAGTKTILSAIDTGLKGTNSNFDNDVLHNKAENIIKNQMYKDRANQSLIIKGNMKLFCADYSLEEAISDLSNYRNAGQFDRALTNLENQTGGDAQKQGLKDAAASPGSKQAVDAVKQLTVDSGASSNSAIPSGNKAGVAAAAAGSAATSAGAPTAAINAAIGAAATAAGNGATAVETGAAASNAAKNAGASPAAAKATADAVTGAASVLTPP